MAKGYAEKFFIKELRLIKDPNIRETLVYFLNFAVPKYFWKIPASTTGNYHPSFDFETKGALEERL